MTRTSSLFLILSATFATTARATNPGTSSGNTNGGREACRHSSLTDTCSGTLSSELDELLLIFGRDRNLYVGVKLFVGEVDLLVLRWNVVEHVADFALEPET